MVKITETEFNQLAAYIKKNIGIHLRKEKMTLVNSRLHSILEKNNFTNFGDYYNYLVKNKSKEDLSHLVERITTNHTYFMRENSHFDFLSKEVLPIIKKTSRDKDIRIWSAGCSSGQEPYNIQMVLHKFFMFDYNSWNTDILATDISNKVLTKAKNGIYLESEMESVPDDFKRHYFEKMKDGSYKVKDFIKDRVIFRNFNLISRTFPFRRKFHVIFCRNVMIYFDAKTKTELLNKYYDILEKGGYLFISHSESLIGLKTKFKYVKTSVYRKE